MQDYTRKMLLDFRRAEKLTQINAGKTEAQLCVYN